MRIMFRSKEILPMILTRSELSTDRPSSARGSISGLIGLEVETTRGSCPTHSSGVSTMRSITPRNAARTPIAVFADVSTNRQPIRAAYAAASAVGTCRACSCVVSDSDQEGKRRGWELNHTLSALLPTTIFTVDSETYLLLSANHQASAPYDSRFVMS
jgi:hypothetical protein